MQDLAIGTHWALAGRRGEFAAGNGAAMLIAPLAFLLNPTDSHDRTLIRDVCRITNHSDEAYVGALAVVLAMWSVLTGTWSQDRSFLTGTVDRLPDSAVRDRVSELIQLQLPASEVAHRFGATGHVVDTVPLALYCAQLIASEPLPTVLARTISVGGDTDTIASIAGQLAGTVVGSAGVPQDLLTGIRGGDELRAISEDFADFVTKGNQQSIQMEA
jgi:ADP-ribosyl-[dinitrogen reductase] hydrolase